jgi:hypothetical protein
LRCLAHSVAGQFIQDGVRVTVTDQKAGLWVRGFLAAGLYIVAAAMPALSLPAVGVETTPTSDPDTAAGAFFCLSPF